MWYVQIKPCPLSVLVGGHALLAVTLTSVSAVTSVVTRKSLYCKYSVNLTLTILLLGDLILIC